MNSSILFISHEATLTGAPILLLHLIEELRPRLSEEIVVLLGKDGPLRSRFEQLGLTVLIYEQPLVPRWQAALRNRLGGQSAHLAARLSKQLRGRNIRLVFGNTLANGRLIDALQLAPQVPLITYAHELRFTIEMQQLVHGDVPSVLARTNYFLAGSDAVRQELLTRGVSSDKIEVLYSSIPFAALAGRLAAVDAVAVRQELGLASDSQLVVGIGTANWRKGNDWFVEMAARLARQRPGLRFAWVGVSPGTLEHMQMSHDVACYGLAGQFALVPVTPAYLSYLALADVFVLSSREDPFPLVVLEAAVAGKPTVCFAGAGGAPEFVGTAHGAVVPYGDVAALAEATEALLASPARARALGAAARAAVRTGFDVAVAAARVEGVIKKAMNTQQ